jgi:NADPH-dependent glutamate synthase beta subunit-like oxidoreductase
MADRSDLTSLPDLTHARPMRPLVGRRPVYADALPPCNAACPAGEDIQGWLALAQAGEMEAAFHALTRDNPLPAIHGRVCYHPCESSCNRGELDAPVGIHAVERLVGDTAIAEGYRFTPGTPTGRRVLVVGAGPSGLSAAYHLRKLGHEVEVHDAGPSPGGMMLVGIPAFRLPRSIIAAEAARIEAMGARFVLGRKVDDVIQVREEGRFDAVFLAIGAHLGKKTEIPARDAGKVLDALTFLESAARGEAPRLGRRVAIYGGGNTAMDAARVAKRLGHDPLIIYRRDREHMPAHPIEADLAIEEGVRVHWLRSIRAIEGTRFEVEVMELDERGRPRPTGRTETLEADALVLALGQDVDTSFLRRVPGVELDADGTVKVASDLMTGHAGLFAGGDMVPSERTVTIAVGHGKKAARHIDAFLRSARVPPRPKARSVGLSDLRLWYSTDAEASREGQLDGVTRTSSFEEVAKSLSRDEGIYEAKRCLSCGNCFECDGCLGSCPSGAVVKLGRGKRYRFDYDRCTGCAVCFEQCPAHAIVMENHEESSP